MKIIMNNQNFVFGYTNINENILFSYNVIYNKRIYCLGIIKTKGKISDIDYNSILKYLLNPKNNKYNYTYFNSSIGIHFETKTEEFIFADERYFIDFILLLKSRIEHNEQKKITFKDKFKKIILNLKLFFNKSYVPLRMLNMKFIISNSISKKIDKKNK